MSFSSRTRTAAVVTASACVATLLGGATAAHAIVGGKAVTAATHKAKYQFVVDISTGAKTPSGDDVKCVGALIAPKKVLTSFNCLATGDGSQDTTTVVGGRKNLNGKGGTVSGVAGVDRSADMKYTEDGVPVADVAVLTLTKKMPYTPVALVPKSFTYTAGTKARIVGWGDSGAGTDYSNQLKEANVGILPNSSCAKPYTTKNFQAKTMLCAGKQKGGVDFCAGDEGAPLLVTQGKRQYLAGIASWGYKDCGKANKPGVYTRISAFRWVTQ
ncbi:S1 family peptidase [Streptomyces sp. NPDC002643]